jgi:class 3 adenylate cyclase
LATAAEILVSAVTAEAANRQLAASDCRPVTLKGIAESVDIATVDWH